jgi:hypothetical protein
MVFDNESPPRRAQNMSALLAIIILIGVIIPIPMGAGFADWINETNAPDNVDDKWIEYSTDDGNFSEWDLITTTGMKPYFYWWNDTGDMLKENVTTDNAGLLTSDPLDFEEDLWIYSFNETLLGSDNVANWEEGTPYWLITFGITAKQMYDANINRMDIKMENLISVDQDGDEQDCTVTFTVGGVELFSKTLSASGDGDIDEEVTISIDDLRQAVINDMEKGYLQLKVTGHATDQDPDDTANTLDISEVHLYTYNVAKLFGRDDGLYLAAMISTIVCALGIFLVTPKYTLPFGKNRRF